MSDLAVRSDSTLLRGGLLLAFTCLVLLGAGTALRKAIQLGPSAAFSSEGISGRIDWRQHGLGRVQQSNAAANPCDAAKQPAVAKDRRCDYGNLPGTWVDCAPEGGRWHVFDPACRTINYLQQLKQLQGERAGSAAGAARRALEADSAALGAASTNARLPKASSRHRSSREELYDAAPPTCCKTAPNASGSSPDTAAYQMQHFPVRMLLISDSVDRHIANYTCQQVCWEAAAMAHCCQIVA